MSTTGKGTRWRKVVQDWLSGLGWATKARPWTEPGDDIVATAGGHTLSVECKDHRSLNLAGWVDQAQRQAGPGTIPVVVAHRLGKARAQEAYVIMSGQAFAQLLERLTMAPAMDGYRVRSLVAELAAELDVPGRVIEP